MTENIKEETKSFSNSLLTLDNRKYLKITGVEKIFETNENKICISVTGFVLNILGSALSIEKLDVESGCLEVSGIINEIKYSIKNTNKGSFFKRIFK